MEKNDDKIVREVGRENKKTRGSKYGNEVMRESDEKVVRESKERVSREVIRKSREKIDRT